MKFRLTLFAILLFINHYGYSQEKARSIQYLSIKDTTLLSQINEMTTELSSYGDDFKKGFGYISLHVTQFSNKSDTLITYFLSPQLMFLEKKDSEDLYPDFYTIINKKLVTIYIDPLSTFYFSKRSFTVKSKEQMRSLIDNALEKPGPKVVFNGRKTRLRFNSITFGGTKIYILRGNRSPIIKKVAEG